MGIELESWERPWLMVVLDQVSTRSASNTLRLACEDLEAPPPPIAPSFFCKITCLTFFWDG